MNLRVRSLVSMGVVFAGCHPPVVVQSRAGTADIRHPGPGEDGMGDRLDPADWLITGTTARFVITGAGTTARQEPPGTVLAFARHGRPERPERNEGSGLRAVEPLVRMDTHDLPWTDAVFTVVPGTVRPFLRMTAHVGDAGLTVTREYAADPTHGGLAVRTVITQRGSTVSLPVSYGVRLGWGGALPFAPGLGTVSTEARGHAPWVGIAHHGTAMAWADLRGDLDLAFTEERHGTTRMAGYTEALSGRGITLQPGTSVAHEDMLLVAQGDLTTVARTRADLHGDTLVDVPLDLPDLAEGTLRAAHDGARDGAREEGPRVRFTDVATGTEVLQAEPTRARTVIPLPPGRYTGTVTAQGHAPGDPVVFTVRRGQTPEAVRLLIPPGGHIRVGVSDAATGRDLPVRVVVRGVPPTPDPNLGSYARAAGAGVVVVAPSGRAEIAVPPGRYAVTVSHGPEWTLATVDTTVTETLRGDVTARLTHAVSMDEWMACDLHVHANPSFDSRVTVEDRVASLVVEGIGFATPTEHNVVGDYTAGVAALPENVTAPLLWVPAVEVTTDRSAQPWGHFNVYPYLPTASATAGGPPPFLNSTPRQIFRAARANNPDALIQVNHPRMQPNIGYFNVTGLDTRTHRAVSPEYDPGYDAIEVFNGFYIGHVEYVEAGLTDWFNLLNTGARYVATGSSDSHAIAYQWAGYPRTYVDISTDDGAQGPGRVAVGPAGVPATDAATVLRSLRGGHAFVSSGPMLFLDAEGHGPGESVALPTRRTVTLRVRVSAAPWIPVESVDIIRDGQRVLTLAVRPGTQPSRLDTEVHLTMDPGSWVVATAQGPRGALDVVLPDSHGQPFAFTNPIFFERPGAHARP